MRKAIMASLKPVDIDSNAKTMGDEQQINHATKHKGDEQQINHATKHKEDSEASGEIQVKAGSVDSWTIINKEEVETDIDEDQSSYISYKKKASEGDLKDSCRESDSESIEVISEDELHASPGTSSSIALHHSFSSDSISFPSPATSSDSLSLPSLTSQLSSVESILSDGIPIADSDKNHQSGQPLYVWNNDVGMEDRLTQTACDGNNDVLEQEHQGRLYDNVDADADGIDESEQEIHHGNLAHILLNNEPVDEIEDEPDHNINHEYVGADVEEINGGAVRQLDHGEPGYDLDDDGLPGAPLQPLEENADLYPSQELVENFPLIERGEVYKHSRNRNLNFLLSGLLVVVLAMVIGLGVGHWRGLSERMEVQEMYEIIQEEKLETITDELVTCITGEEGMGGDDQELDERVIRQLRDENEELRDQLQKLKSNLNGQGEEAMLIILKNKIKALMATNSDLEGEVARLKSRNSAQNDLSNQKLERETVSQKPTIDLAGIFATFQGSERIINELEESKESMDFNDLQDSGGGNDLVQRDQSDDTDEPNLTMEFKTNPQSNLVNDNQQHLTEHPKSALEFEINPPKYWPNDNEESMTNVQKPVTKFGNILNLEVSNLIIGLENKWEEIKTQWEKIDEIMKTVDKNEENTQRWVQQRNTSKEMGRDSYNDWNSKRGEGRRKWRVNNARADWLFERAKYRRDGRHEEIKTDWYFQNKHAKNYKKDDGTCFKDFDDCQADDKEEANKLKKFNKKNKKEGDKQDEWDYKRKYKNKFEGRSGNKDNRQKEWASKAYNNKFNKYKLDAENRNIDTDQWSSKKYKKNSKRKIEKKENNGKWDSKKSKKKYNHEFDKRNGNEENKRGEWASKKDKKKYKHKFDGRSVNEENKKEIYEWDKDSGKYVKRYKYESQKEENKRGEWDSKKYKKKYNPEFHDKYEHRINFPEENDIPEAYLHHYQDRIKRWVQDYY